MCNYPVSVNYASVLGLNPFVSLTLLLGIIVDI